MTYRLRTMGGLFMLYDLEPLMVSGPQYVGQLLQLDDNWIQPISARDDGFVWVKCESLDAEPPLGEEWDDIAEVSARAVAKPVELPISLEGSPTKPNGSLAADPSVDLWRVRVSACGRYEAAESTGRAVERFMIQTWPAEPQAPTVLRELVIPDLPLIPL